MHETLRRVPRSFLITLLGAAFLHSSAEPRSEPGTKPETVVVLTAGRPVQHLPIPAGIWKEKRTSLAISVVKIKNPLHATFSIDISLEVRADSKAESKINGEPVEVGTLGIYPADQTAGYRLETSPALRRIHASAADHLDLRLELRRVHPKERQDGLEVTLSLPQWLPTS